MNKEFSDDLLSAHFDGETSDEESRKTASHLANSVEAQQEFAEIRQLSKLLQGLPREQVPGEFLASVMQAAERASLLPQTLDAAETEVPSRRANWRFRMVALVTTTAALVLMVSIFDRAKRDAERQQATATSDSVRLSEEAPVVLAEASRKTTDAPVIVPTPQEAVAMSPVDPSFHSQEASKADSDELLERESQVLAKGSSLVAKAVPASEPLLKMEKRPFQAGLKAALVMDQPQAAAPTDAEAAGLLFDNRALGRAEVGDVVEALETSGNRVAVIKLTVIDRRGGLESLQVLLAKNQIPVTVAAGSDVVAEPAEPPADRLMAVFVETNSAQLSTALNEFRQDEQFRELHVEPTIEIASLDMEVRTQMGVPIAQDELRQRPKDAARGAAAAPSRRGYRAEGKAAGRFLSEQASVGKEMDDAKNDSPLPSKPAEMEQVRQQPAPPVKRGRKVAGAELAQRPAALDQAVASLSRQVVVSVPMGVLDVGQAGTAQRRTMLAFGGQGGQDKKIQPRANVAEELAGQATPPKQKLAVPRRSLQVLLVLVADSHATDKPAAASAPAASPSHHDASKKAPGDGAA